MPISSSWPAAIQRTPDIASHYTARATERRVRLDTRQATALGVGIAAAILLLTLQLSGLCFAEFRYLAEAEAIERALIYRASLIKGLDKPGGASREDVRAYLRDHPDCCRIERECPVINTGSGWLEKFLEWGAP